MDRMSLLLVGRFQEQFLLEVAFLISFSTGSIWLLFSKGIITGFSTQYRLARSVPIHTVERVPRLPSLCTLVKYRRRCPTARLISRRASYKPAAKPDLMSAISARSQRARARLWLLYRVRTAFAAQGTSMPISRS